MSDSSRLPAELTVGELAARSGVAVSALHYYERQNLITSRRTAGNQRRYRRETLRRIALIRIAQRVGIPLSRSTSSGASSDVRRASRSCRARTPPRR